MMLNHHAQCHNYTRTWINCKLNFKYRHIIYCTLPIGFYIFLSFLVSPNLVLLNIAIIFIPPLPFTVSPHVTLNPHFQHSTSPLFKFLTCSTALMILELQCLAKYPVLLQRKRSTSIGSSVLLFGRL